MCHFITVTLPHDVELKSIAQLFKAHKLGFRSISNPHVAKQIDPHDCYILTTTKHCDCGTALGSLTDIKAETINYDRELKKLRKQGWSEAKINRWMEQQEQTRERRDRNSEKTATVELTRWIELLEDLIGKRLSPRLGLLLHMYSGAIDSERIKIKRRQRVPLSDVNPERLMTIEEDVLYEITSK